MLSEENYAKLNENYLYKKEYDWSKPHINWTFKVRKLDGKACMLDTYFGTYDSHPYKVTDENIDEFEKVFDFREMRKLKKSEEKNYNHEQLIRVATDSGGYSCGGLFWVKKDEQPSTDKMVENAKDKIVGLESRLRWAKEDLERLSK